MGRGDPPDILQWLQCPCTLPGPPGRPQTSPPSPLTRTPARSPPPPRGPEEHRFPRLSWAASPCPGTCSRGCAGTGLGSAALVGFGSPGRGWRKGCEQQRMGTGIPAQLCGKRWMRLLKKWCYPRRAAMAEVICVLCASLGRKPAVIDGASQVRAR